MNTLLRLKAYLPLAARVLSTAAAAIMPIAVAEADRQPVTSAVVAAAFVAGAAAWKRWHPSASLSAIAVATATTNDSGSAL